MAQKPRAGAGEAAAEASERPDDPGSPKSGAVTGPVPALLSAHASDAEDVVMHERGSSDEGRPAAAAAAAPTAAPTAGSSAAADGSDAADDDDDDESSPSELFTAAADLPYTVVKLRCRGLSEGGYPWELKAQPSASPADVESSSGPRRAGGGGTGAGASRASATGPRTAAWHAVTAVATELVASLSHAHVRLAVAYTDEARGEALRLFRDLNHLSLRGGISCERVVMHASSHTVLLQFKADLYACAATYETSEHCVMLRLLATHPRMTRHGFGRVVIHFLKELGRKLGKQAIVAYTYPNAQPFYEALDFKLTGHLENEMAFNIQRSMGSVLASLRDLSESHPYACTRRSRHEPAAAPTAPAPRAASRAAADGGAAAAGAKTEARIERIWDRRSGGAEDGGAAYLVQWAGSAIEDAQWASAAELAQCARALARFDEAHARMLAAMPPTCRPPTDESLASAIAELRPTSPPAPAAAAAKAPSPRSPAQAKAAAAAPARQPQQPPAQGAAGRRANSRETAAGAGAKQPPSQRKSAKRGDPGPPAAPTPPRDDAPHPTPPPPPPSGRQRSRGTDDNVLPSPAAQEHSRSTLTTGTHAAPGAPPHGADGSQAAMQAPPPPFAARAESSSPPLTAIDSDLHCEQAGQVPPLSETV